MKVIENVNQNLKTFEFKWFFNLTAKAEDVTIDKDCLDDSCRFRSILRILPTEENYLQGYFVGGRYFVYCDDGYVYEGTKNGVQPVMRVNGTPCAVSFNALGKEKILFADDSKTATLIDEDGITTVSFEPTEFLDTYGGRIFSIYQNTVSFTKLYDFSDENFDLSQEGVLYLPKSEGGVIGVFKVDGELYLFTKTSLYVLSGSGDSIDFKLNKVETEKFSVDERAICKCDDGFAFICEKRLAKLKDGKVTHFNTLLDMNEYSISGKMTACGNLCLIPVEIDAEKYLFTYDLRTERQSLIYIYDQSVFEDGGVVFSKIFNTVANLSDQGFPLNSSRTWESKSLDLESEKNKAIREIFIYTELPASLTITGDFGSVKYTLVTGRNVIKCNLPSRFYKVKITASTSRFKVNDFKLKYTERGK